MTNSIVKKRSGPYGDKYLTIPAKIKQIYSDNEYFAVSVENGWLVYRPVNMSDAAESLPDQSDTAEQTPHTE